MKNDTAAACSPVQSITAKRENQVETVRVSTPVVVRTTKNRIRHDRWLAEKASFSIQDFKRIGESVLTFGRIFLFVPCSGPEFDLCAHRAFFFFYVRNLKKNMTEQNRKWN